MRSAPGVLLLGAILVGCSSNDPSKDATPGDRGQRSEMPIRGDGPQSPDIDTATPLNATAPSSTVKLVFVHHSVGEYWSTPAPVGGDLRVQLNQNKYFVRDTNYGWGPIDADTSEGTIGDHTDIGQWAHWFLGDHRDTYLGELFKTDHLTAVLGQNSIADPGGNHTVVLFKSCFLSGQNLHGGADDPPTTATGRSNPIHGKDLAEDAAYTVSNIKGLYRDLLGTFATRQDKLFVLLTTPPSRAEEATAASPALLRGVNTWLVHHWLESYPHHNVAVFDLHNVLTSNGGAPDHNDVGAASGSHHRFRAGAVEHLVGSSGDLLAYPTEDSHPTPAGTGKASAEFVPLLNIAYHCWKGTGGCPHLMGRP